MQEIPYVIRSGFLPTIEEALNRLHNLINTGCAVQIDLEPGGYNGDTIVVISTADAFTFETSWRGQDPTRFPQRIRTAATALHRCGFEGTFHIVHENGVLVICAARSAT